MKYYSEKTKLLYNTEEECKAAERSADEKKIAARNAYEEAVKLKDAAQRAFEVARKNLDEAEAKRIKAREEWSKFTLNSIFGEDKPESVQVKTNGNDIEKDITKILNTIFGSN